MLSIVEFWLKQCKSHYSKYEIYWRTKNGMDVEYNFHFWLTRINEHVLYHFIDSFMCLCNFFPYLISVIIVCWPFLTENYICIVFNVHQSVLFAPNFQTHTRTRLMRFIYLFVLFVIFLYMLIHCDDDPWILVKF